MAKKRMPPAPAEFKVGDRVRGSGASGTSIARTCRTLEAYHECLSSNLVFPFLAERGAEYGHPARVKAVGLGDPDDGQMIDEMHGVLCEV